MRDDTNATDELSELRQWQTDLLNKGLTAASVCVVLALGMLTVSRSDTERTWLGGVLPVAAVVFLTLRFCVLWPYALRAGAFVGASVLLSGCAARQLLSDEVRG